MQVASMHFKERAHVKLADARLQTNLKKLQTKFVAKRRASLVELDDFEATREAGKAIRNRALENLDVWLEIFEKNATARGATVLFAETPADINSLVLEIAAKHRVAKIIKSIMRGWVRTKSRLYIGVPRKTHPHTNMKWNWPIKTVSSLCGRLRHSSFLAMDESPECGSRMRPVLRARSPVTKS